MSPEAWAAVLAIIGLFGGAFGKTLLDRWGERDRLKAAADGAAQSVNWTDSEQARKWLREQLAERDAKLEERDAELKEFRAREIMLMERVGHLAEQVARQEERMAAQGAQISALQANVAKWGADYEKMEQERDRYRSAKHDADNTITPLLLRATAAERELTARDEEIARLRAQVAVLSTRDGAA